MFKKTYIICIILLLLAALVQAETFDEADVLGSWFVYELDVDPSIGTYWNYADIDVIETTNIVGDITTPDGTTTKLVDGVPSIDSMGFLSGLFTTETGVTGTIVDGRQDQGHSIFSYVSIDTQNALGLAVGIKAGEG